MKEWTPQDESHARYSSPVLTGLQRDKGTQKKQGQMALQGLPEVRCLLGPHVTRPL